jgi:hypothetical protein
VAASRSITASRTAGSRVARRLLTLGLGVVLFLSELIMWQRAHMSLVLECCGRIPRHTHPELFIQANAVLLGICLVVLAVILALRWRRRVA